MISETDMRCDQYVQAHQQFISPCCLYIGVDGCTLSFVRVFCWSHYITSVGAKKIGVRSPTQALILILVALYKCLCITVYYYYLPRMDKIWCYENVVAFDERLSKCIYSLIFDNNSSSKLFTGQSSQNIDNCAFKNLFYCISSVPYVWIKIFVLVTKQKLIMIYNFTVSI